MPEQQNRFIDTKNFVGEWNFRYPYDYWWRKKYNVPFGSAKHRAQNHVDMYIEWEEDRYFERLSKERAEQEWYEDGVLQKGATEGVVKMTKKEVNEAFESLNLEDFNDPDIK